MSDPASSSLARALQQELEGWRRAGLTHLPMPARKRSSTKSTQKSATARPPTSASAPPRGAAGSTAQSATAVSKSASKTTPAVVAGAQPATSNSLPVLSPSFGPSPFPVGSREDRQWQLDQLKQRVAQCTRCQELATARTHTVFGVGNPEAKIMFVGEAPGADEDAQGIPFVGAAGQLLNKILVASGLNRDDVYICNILRCRPPGNRKPLPVEASNCREYLDGQIAIIDPDWIICLGATAAQNLLDTQDAIGRLRGKFLSHGRAKVLCTYHPSYLLRNPPAKKDVWEDMKLFLQEAGLPVPGA